MSQGLSQEPSQEPSKESRPVIFGEVLYDRFPDGRQVLGGAPFNVAWHLQAFGLNPYFISSVGNDELGVSIKNAMIDWGMDISGLQVNETHPSGTVEVSINNNEPSYDIVDQRAWDYIEYSSIDSPVDQSVLYHGSLATRNKTSRITLEKIKTGYSCPLFIDVNLRSPWWQKESVRQYIETSQIVKINEEELALLVTEERTLNGQIDYLLKNSSIETLIVTCGAEGAIAALKSGEQIRVKPEKTNKLVDTVGAGDSFSSVVLLGTIKQWPLKLTMERAQQFASRIVGIQGATISDKTFYDALIASWNKSGKK